MYEIKKDIPVPNGRSGPKLAKFPLEEMEVGDAFVIPYVSRTIRGRVKASPETGFNVKAANEQFKPKVFKKSRGANGVTIHRIE